ncbi:protein spaetzle 4-like [Temnothorax curvispinosus]|uniref:Protein spaetzle 4-like n=1 Tax=Temnothorax curvispinosus TaxID=300111 RepID=A0A6J1R963_9HYME|nr:protein spaetzle 4-like [Temnothorax curvispinosus]
MKAIAPFVLQVIALQLTRCQSGGGGGGGGGPSTFGYDASSACSKPYSRAGRAHHEDLPCDFRQQNWCTIAGSSYPWHAVRRFVQENQGLMRRMYGDENYISVLRTEFEKNDIELKYDEYYHHFADDLRQFQYDDDYEFIDDDRAKDNEYEGRGFTSRSFNDPIAKRMNKFSKLSEYTRPHFRPTERTTSSTTPSSTTTTSSTSSSTSTSAPTLVTRASSSTTPVSTSTVTSMEEVKTQTSVTSTSPKFSNITTKVADNDSVVNSTTTTTTTTISTSTLPSVTVAQIVKEQNFSINEIPGQNDRIDEELEEPEPEVVAYSEKTTIEDTTLEPAGTTRSVPTESLVDQEEEEEEETLGAATKTTVHEELIIAASHEQQQQFRPRPEYRPSGMAETSTNTGGQLYQDAAKDQQEQPVLKLRGVNACPVKEEVVAPFWANNTRGEVLALLNLYPFEQYVHWEKCTHENKQMYCRDGCRCEQQYRLHRLLAYDPNNECRGIFSDWFKFPSCCVCRCYDLPLEFRVTSRSPRTSHKRRIKVQSPTRNRYP